MTVEDVLEGAYGKSSKTSPTEISARTLELLGVFHLALSGLYSVAARVNDRFFGKRLQVPYDGVAGGWPRPAAAESIYAISLASGARVWLLQDDNLYAVTGEPAVFEEGGVFYLAPGAVGLTTADNLVFGFSRRSTKPAALADLVDFPEAFADLLQLEVAIYLALWDDRKEDAASFKAQRDEWAVRYIAHLEHASTALVRSDSFVRQFHGRTLVELGQLFAGGGA